jgi:hypothetical protein
MDLSKNTRYAKKALSASASAGRREAHARLEVQDGIHDGK